LPTTRELSRGERREGNRNAAATQGRVHHRHERIRAGEVAVGQFHGQSARVRRFTTRSFFNRTEYAVSRIFVTRGDSGHTQFNFSEIFGAAIAAGISTYSYHPHADRTLPNTASVWGTQVGYDTITLVVKEFWPDIRRKLKKQHH